MTYTYEVIINTPPKDVEEFKYSYARTEKIAIVIKKAGARITANMSKDYRDDWEGSYAQKLIQDAVRRCALIYLIRYSMPMPIKTIKVLISTKGVQIISFDITEKTKAYYLIEGRLQRKVSTNLLSKQVLEEVVREMKSDYGKRTAALYAYLLSKSKVYEAERFVYLWMAFNGVYSYWGQKAGIWKDTKQIVHLLNKYKWGSSITPDKNVRTKMGERTSLALNGYNHVITSSDIKSREVASLEQKIFEYPEMNNVDITFYGYLLCDYSYYLRCTMIHASKPIPLISFENEMDIKVLRTANSLLEDFLDNHLYECFEERN